MKRKLPQKLLLLLFFFIGCVCTDAYAIRINTGVDWITADLNGRVLKFTVTDESGFTDFRISFDNKDFIHYSFPMGEKSFTDNYLIPDDDDVVFYVMKIDTYGVETHVNFQVISLPEEPQQPPVPSYFPVTIPSVEGVTTIPAAGNHSVAYGEPFDLSIEVSNAYDESDITLLVNGVALDPVSLRSTLYSYRIEQVYSFIDFEIQGVKKNDPLGINSPSGDVAYSVYTEASRLCIQALKPSRLTVYGVDGKVYDQRNIGEGLTQLPLPAGIYIVRIGEESWKVVIKD